jgi:glycosyltransferase involved in cell wall biosynthesis
MAIPKIRINSPLAWGNGAHVIHRLLENRISGYRVAGYNPYWTLFPFILPAVVSAKEADLIHTTPDYAHFFYKKNIPLVITFHNYILDRWMQSHSSPLQRLHYATDLRLWTRMAVKRACRITAVSRFTAQLVSQDLGLADPVDVIYNGVDTDLFFPAKQRHTGADRVRVLFSGNLSRRKGAHWLPGIADKLEKNAIIYFTQGPRGEGSLIPKDNLQGIGSVPFNQMPVHYRKMDILLMPTVREGFGLAIAEAMACGLPVVASDCSAIPEIIDHGKGGFLCPVGDVNAFAEKITLLAESPSLRRDMGDYNRAKVEKMFTLDRMANEYQKLFEDVTQR